MSEQIVEKRVVDLIPRPVVGLWGDEDDGNVIGLSEGLQEVIVLTFDVLRPSVDPMRGVEHPMRRIHVVVIGDIDDVVALVPRAFNRELARHERRGRAATFTLDRGIAERNRAPGTSRTACTTTPCTA